MQTTSLSTAGAFPDWHGTTILAVRKAGATVIAGDGQVSMGQTIVKGNARKVRALAGGRVVAGFAGATADAFTLIERLEAKLEQYPRQLARACVDLAKDWRTDRYLRRLEAMLIAADAEGIYTLSGVGDVLEPEHGVASIGSGGAYALAAARALMDFDLTAEEIARRAMGIAADICVYTNRDVTVETVGGMTEFSPREIVSELDRYVVGHAEAKRAVAVALRNRWRRRRLAADLIDEVTPKNILMIGPTGVGKTEIARRLAKLAQSPFLKVEATKFTEVGYVGRDVDQIIRDLLEAAILAVREKRAAAVKARAEAAAEDRLLDALVGAGAQASTREAFRKKLRAGELDDKDVELDLADTASPLQGFDIPGQPGASMSMINLTDIMGKAFGARRKAHKTTVSAAWGPLIAEESDKLLDQDAVTAEAIDLTENAGIVFIDEIDKVASRAERGGADVSREGVQRDLLPLIEGTTVSTKHGPVKTDHILFIASGAFHVAKPSDLLPELQGRLPIRVELKALTRDDLRRILTEPEANLIRQHQALLATEGVTLTFTEAALDALADAAQTVNGAVENIGARRLQTVLETVVEDISFTAADRSGESVVIDADDVHRRVGDLAKNADLSRYIL